MKSNIPKQFLLLGDKPVLMHTIERFYFSDLKPEIIVVLNEHYHSYWNELCIRYNFQIPYILIKGGKERFYSVKNALLEVDPESVTAVHDAVRPLVSNELITRCYRLAEINGTAIPVVPCRDSLRKKEADGSKTIPRENILLVQTPQVFKSALLKNAYNQSYYHDFTDDASVVEKAGQQITLTDGDPKNIKITYPEDISVASVFINTDKNEQK